MENVINFDLLKEYDGTLKEVLKVWQKQKSYSVDDTVQYKGNYLKCTTAGTSGTTTLDFTDVEVGDTITDGTVVWEVIEPPSGGGGGIAEYTTGTSYSSGDLVIKDNALYKANTTTSTTWVDSEWDIIGTTFNTTSAYAQKIVTNVVAPYEMLLQVGDSNYCKPPIDVLKKTGGSDNVTLTLENYNNPSAYTGTSDFLKIENSKAKLYNYKEYPITPQTLSTIDIGVSDEIDFDDFASSSSSIPSDVMSLMEFEENIDLATNEAWDFRNSFLSDTQAKFGSKSIYINKVKGPLSITDNFDFLGNDFTIDCWIYPTNISDPYNSIFSSVTDIKLGVNIRYGVLSVYLSSSGSSWDISVGDDSSENGYTGQPVVQNTWQHIALVRSNNNFMLFYNGNKVWQITSSSAIVNRKEAFQIGSWGYEVYNCNFTGYVDEFRCIIGRAVWAEDFTPPTQPYSRSNYNITSLEVN